MKKDLEEIFSDSFRELFYECYRGVLDIFIDPREEEGQVFEDNPKFSYERYIRTKYFLGESSMMYHLGVLSSISCLRTGYEDLHGNC